MKRSGTTLLRTRLPVLALAMVMTGVVSATQSPSNLAPAHGTTASPDSVLAGAVIRRDVPGVVAMVTNRRETLYQGAFGSAELETSRALTMDAIFRIASMTKPVTSVAAMQLVEQGRLLLDDPAAKYLPELANLKILERFDVQTGAYTVSTATKTLTVRHLLTHTSGLGYTFTSSVLRDFKPKDGEAYAAGPLLFEPGTAWMYGTSTNWVGRLVETISGQNLEEYFRDHIFTPLGMRDTFYTVPDEHLKRLVPAYRRRADGAFELRSAQPPALRGPVIGGAGLASTAADYSRFLQMFLNGGTLNGVRVLSPETIASMGQNQIGSVGVRALKTALPEISSDFAFIVDGRDKWGLGFLITADPQRGKRSAGSLSWGGLNNTYFWVDPMTGVAGVVLMQFQPFADTKALAVLDAFERAVYALPAVVRQ